MKATAPVPAPPPASAQAGTPATAPDPASQNNNRAFFLQSTLSSYEVEELSGWQLAAILSELPRMSGAGDRSRGGSSGG